MKNFRIFAIMTIFAAVLMLGGCPPSGAPLAGFRATPTSGPAPLVVQFTDMSRTAKAAGIVSWSWDFGDGSGSAEQNPTHVYTTKGDYTVSLTATNDTGKTNTARQARYIKVSSEGEDEQTIMLPGNVPLELVRIPAGSFQMGSPDTERSRWNDEGPVRTVNIGYDFYMGKYEVTQAQWLAVMGSRPGGYTWDYGQGDNHPAYYVSWKDAQAFITTLNAYITETGQGPTTMRLPSEAEWEYACRAGTQTRFYFGDSLGVGDSCEDDGVRSQYMWYCGNNTLFRTKPVGGKLPNAFGLYDMHGNVYEWCEDWWHGNYTGAPTDGSAWVSPSAAIRVIRGGGWNYFARYCRSAYRNNTTPLPRNNNVGFRLASVR